jgi:LysM repeat protein
MIKLIALLLAALLLAACDRLSLPAPAGNADPGVDFSDPNVGGGVGEATGPQTPVPTATATRENSPRLDATAAAVATFPPTPTPTADSRPLTTAPTIAAPTVPPPTVEPPTATAQPPAPTPEPSPTAAEITHVVQPGENLYRIGLIYGLSWVAIAEYNGIANANAIIVGQELRIPPTPTPTPQAQSLAPTTDNRPQTTAGMRLTVVSGQWSVVSGRATAFAIGQSPLSRG